MNPSTAAPDVAPTSGEFQMNVKGKTKGDATQLVVKSNQKNDGYKAELDVDISTTRKQCEKLFGEEFAALAFGQMLEVEGEGGLETIHLAASITAAKRFRLGKHVINLNGYEVIAQPQLRKISPVQKSDRVVTHVRMPVHVGEDEGLGAQLVSLVGETVEINFSPAQQDLPLAKGSKS